jgi:hypothetical protein
LYQLLWFLCAETKAALGSYLRGFLGALRGRNRMKQEHRDLMAKRKIQR